MITTTINAGGRSTDYVQAYILLSPQDSSLVMLLVAGQCWDARHSTAGYPVTTRPSAVPQQSLTSSRTLVTPFTLLRQLLRVLH